MVKIKPSNNQQLVKKKLKKIRKIKLMMLRWFKKKLAMVKMMMICHLIMWSQAIVLARVIWTEARRKVMQRLSWVWLASKLVQSPRSKKL